MGADAHRDVNVHQIHKHTHPHYLYQSRAQLPSHTQADLEEELALLYADAEREDEERTRREEEQQQRTSCYAALSLMEDVDADPARGGAIAAATARDGHGRAVGFGPEEAAGRRGLPNGEAVDVAGLLPFRLRTEVVLSLPGWRIRFCSPGGQCVRFGLFFSFHACTCVFIPALVLPDSRVPPFHNGCQAWKLVRHCLNRFPAT